MTNGPVTGEPSPGPAPGAGTDVGADVGADVGIHAGTEPGDAPGDPVAGAGSTGVARGHRRIAAAVAVGWWAVDQLTKHWAVNALVDRDIPIVWTLQLNLAFNRGMAFSRGEGWGPVIAVAAMLIVVVLLVNLRQTGTLLGAVATGMVVGGALGNLTDRLFREGEGGFLHGAVVDFIDLQWFPIFNVADIGITVGAPLLLFAAWRSDRGVPAPAAR